MNNSKTVRAGQSAKRTYSTPSLICYGTVKGLTQTGSVAANEASGSCLPTLMLNTMSCSDPQAKMNINRIGTHPLGIGLYLFDYKPEFRQQWGYKRQFGVMADEVKTVIPAAVHTHPDGYQVVDYAMLGISRFNF